MQGFPANWTLPAAGEGRRSYRWKLVGNAVTVDVAEWLGRRLISPGEYEGRLDLALGVGDEAAQGSLECRQRPLCLVCITLARSTGRGSPLKRFPPFLTPNFYRRRPQPVSFREPGRPDFVSHPGS